MADLWTSQNRREKLILWLNKRHNDDTSLTVTTSQTLKLPDIFPDSPRHYTAHVSVTHVILNVTVSAAVNYKIMSVHILQK